MAAPLAGLRAVVFDAYGTLFDVASAAERTRDLLGEKAGPLADLWRQKQLQYTWLRALMGHHADFWQVTGEALDYSLDAMRLASTPDLRRRLMEAYERIGPCADAREALVRLKAARLKLAILSNGAPRMLAAAVRSAGLDDLIDETLSVEAVGIYKPHPSVYKLAVDRLGVWPAELGFVSANGWDAWGAKAAGLRVAWCNRAGLPRERLGEPPDVELTTLADLPRALGLSGAPPS
jgi:2-haloacid dehalogenase